MNSPGTDLHEEEHRERFQAQRFHRKEITGQQLLLVLAEKGAPGAPLPGTHGCGRNMLAFQRVSNG